MNTTDQARTLAVTGGASGIGFATAQRWLQRTDSRVVLLDRSPEALDRAVGELGDRSRGIPTDVTSSTSVDGAFADIARCEGRLDGLVACAGVSRVVETATMTDEEWQVVVDVHLTGTMRACRAAHPLLKSAKGAIVTLSSVAGKVGMPQRASYNAVKHGIDGLTRSLAVEWAGDGIRCNAVGPGYVRTPFTGTLIEAGKLDPTPIEERTPLARFAEPDEIAGPIVWLLGDDASYVTGHVLMVDGGMTTAGDWYNH